jgi:diguanylate cyclase (GGDEF)-like protein
VTRVLLLLQHQRNAHLLAEWLAPSYQVAVGDDLAALDQPFDLAIVDGPALRELGGAIRQRKDREAPILLPVLLVTRLHGANLGEQELWRHVDEVIGSPVQKQELLMRLQVLLRARGLSLELKASHETQLRHMALHDPVTDLPNRRLFLDRLNMAIARTRADRRLLAVLLLDLDRFKTINESYGHAFGDLLLQAVAERLAASLPRDALASFGGDAFAVLLPDLGRLTEAALTAQRLLDALARPFVMLGHTVYATTSIGITLHPVDSEDAAGLLENADTALDRAKSEGGGTYQFYTPQMKARVLERLNLETRLRGAAERGELTLEYQPQVALKSRRIVGFEALMRWHDPELGPVGPSRFIPIAEESGLVESIGAWALATACRQNKAWQDAGLPPLRGAINLSARHFRHGVEKTVGEVLAETGLDPRWLELEITESSLLEYSPESLEVLHRLKALGVHLAIDDFGTGYSSMSYLKRLPVATLKIDHAFVRDMARDADSRAIVQAIIAVAHSLNLNVIAEGAETAEQLAGLEELGCDEVQGHVFSRALPAPTLERLLRRSQNCKEARTMPMAV